MVYTSKPKAAKVAKAKKPAKAAKAVAKQSVVGITIPTVADLPGLPDLKYPDGTEVLNLKDQRIYKNRNQQWALILVVLEITGPESPSAYVVAQPTLPNAFFPVGTIIYNMGDGKTYQNRGETWILLPLGTQTVPIQALPTKSASTTTTKAAAGTTDNVVAQLALTPHDHIVVKAGELQPVMEVVGENVGGKVVESWTGVVDVALKFNPNHATLSGTLSVGAVAGKAVFANLRINLPGTYTLVFSASGVREVIHPEFKVS